MTATVKTSAPVKLPSRHFYRCNDCLSVVATEIEIVEVYNSKLGRNELTAVCGGCGGRMEYMGETVRTVGLSEFALRQLQGYKCVCDGKCTGAMGPNCDCICGGENHGTGRIVPVYTVSGVPQVAVPKDAVEKAEQYRALVAEFKLAYEAKYGWLNTMKRNGEWISNFDGYMDGQYLWKSYLKAKSLRTHGARNKRLGQLINEAKGQK